MSSVYAVSSGDSEPCYRFRVGVDLKRDSVDADYLLITHGDFIDASMELARYRESRGLSVFVADVEDVYDVFSWGYPSPVGIRDFISYCYSGGDLSFVLLMGDATADTKGYYDGDRNFVPTKFVATDSGYNASDAWYSFVGGDDLFAAVSVGRLPVKTAEGAIAVVQKIIAYEEYSVAGEWRDSAVFVSDRDFIGMEQDLLMGLLPSRIEVMSVIASPSNRSVLTDYWNDGLSFVHFTGHGAHNIWGSSRSPNNPVFRKVDAAGLSNSPRLPFVLVSNCLSGAFALPSFGGDRDSIGEVMLENPYGGAIGVYSSSGLTMPMGQLRMHGYVFSRYSAGERRMGILTRDSLRYLYGIGGAYNAPIIRTWVLLGCPATELK